MGKPIVMFDVPGARAVVQTVRREKRRPVAEVPQRTPGVPLPACKFVVVTTAIQPASTSGPGKGLGQLLAVKYDANDLATWGEPYGPTIPIYTFDTTTGTAAGKKIGCAYFDGRLYNILELCPS